MTHFLLSQGNIKIRVAQKFACPCQLFSYCCVSFTVLFVFNFSRILSLLILYRTVILITDLKNSICDVAIFLSSFSIFHCHVSRLFGERTLFILFLIAFSSSFQNVFWYIHLIFHMFIYFHINSCSPFSLIQYVLNTRYTSTCSTVPHAIVIFTFQMLISPLLYT